MPATDTLDRLDEVRGGDLDVGKLFVDTRQVFFDARANAAEFDEPRMRVDAVYAIVEIMGRFLREIRSLRLEITSGEVGLKGFDADLAGLQQRYRNLYRPFFDNLPHPDEWTDEQWKSLEEDLEGPILLWDLQTCKERWGIAFASPPCEGPDLMMTFSLLHQLGAAQQVEIELIKSIYGLADITMQEIGSYWSDKAKGAGQALAGAFKRIADEAKKYVPTLPGSSTRKYLALGIGAAVVVGGGGYLWLQSKKGRI